MAASSRGCENIASESSRSREAWRRHWCEIHAPLCDIGWESLGSFMKIIVVTWLNKSSSFALCRRQWFSWALDFWWERGRLLFVIIVVMIVGELPSIKSGSLVYLKLKPARLPLAIILAATKDCSCCLQCRPPSCHSLCIDLVEFILPPALGIFIDGHFYSTTLLVVFSNASGPPLFLTKTPLSPNSQEYHQPTIPNNSSSTTA